MLAADRNDGDASDSMPACSSRGSVTHEKTIFEGGLITLYEPATMTVGALGTWWFLYRLVVWRRREIRKTGLSPKSGNWSQNDSYGITSVWGCYAT